MRAFVLVLPTSARRLKLRAATSGKLSSKGWPVVTTGDHPASGGEPLWRVSDKPAIFVPALHAATKCCNRRLPRITQRDAFTPGFSIRLRPAHRAAERWVVPGSRPLPHDSAGFVMGRIREDDETRAKAAPLQAVGDHTWSQRHQPFRGQLARRSRPEFQTTGRSREDDDEYENEVPPDDPASLFNQIAQRGLKQILDWEKALGQSSTRTLER
jgi:hypothetical protein